MIVIIIVDVVIKIKKKNSNFERIEKLVQSDLYNMFSSVQCVK